MKSHHPTTWCCTNLHTYAYTFHLLLNTSLWSSNIIHQSLKQHPTGGGWISQGAAEGYAQFFVAELWIIQPLGSPSTYISTMSHPLYDRLKSSDIQLTAGFKSRCGRRLCPNVAGELEVIRFCFDVGLCCCDEKPRRKLCANFCRLDLGLDLLWNSEQSLTRYSYCNNYSKLYWVFIDYWSQLCANSYWSFVVCKRQWPVESRVRTLKIR